MIIKALFGALIALAACMAQSQPARYYEYVLYLRAAAPSDSEARARAVLSSRSALLHRASDPAGVRAWDGKGLIPVAVEPRNFKGKPIDRANISETGEPLREVLGVAASRPVSALAVMVGIPQAASVPAYVEASRFAADIAAAVDAPAFLDGETGGVLQAVSLSERLRLGRSADGALVSASNPPRLETIDAFTFEALHGTGWRTRGFRKLGVPDVAVVDWMPGRLLPFWEIEAVGNLLVSGKISAAPGSEFTVRTDDPEVAATLSGFRKGASAFLRFAPAPLSSASLLQLEFPGQSGMHLYERQMFFIDALLPSNYLALGAGPARELSMAVARVKSRLPDLRGHYASLKAQGTRVFIGVDMAAAVKNSTSPQREAKWALWHEVSAWTPDGRVIARQWDGDPRTGGSRARFNPPIKIGSIEHSDIESDIPEETIEDVLLIDRGGRTSGGEATDLATRNRR
jgi:hypothetical protein